MGCLLGCRVSGDLEIRYNAGYQSTDHHILDWTFCGLRRNSDVVKLLCELN